MPTLVRLAAAVVLPALLGVSDPALAQAPAASAYVWPTAVEGAENPLLGTPYAANGRGATADASIRLAFVGRDGRERRAVTSTAGGRPLLRGLLTNAQNRPIAGAVVILAREVADRPGWRAVGRLRTSPEGRFRALLSPGWAPRRIGAVYWPFPDTWLPAFSRRVLARVAPRVAIRTSVRGHGLVEISGRVTGSRLPAAGLIVSLQVRNRSSWVGVRLVHADAVGRFSGRYRFAARGRRYTVRAFVPRQQGWRLAAGASPARRVPAR